MLEPSLIALACLCCVVIGWLLHGSEQTAQREADRRTGERETSMPSTDRRPPQPPPSQQ